MSSAGFVATNKKGIVVDPIAFIKSHWPDVTLYDKQRQIAYSVWNNDETVVPAGNELGKDFIAGLLVLSFFLTRHPCRVLTTSVDDTQLSDVLWGEIKRFIDSSFYPLRQEQGGPLVVNDKHIRKIYKGKICGLSYIRGRVADDEGTGMLGHHIADIGDGIPRTLGVFDECSGMRQTHYDMIAKWSKRRLLIGNCFPCNNYFKWSVKGRPGTTDRGGDIERDFRPGYHRKVIRIKAEDSPNVKLGFAEQRAGLTPSFSVRIPGVKSFEKYLENRKLWDPIQQCIGLDADWYEGIEVKLFPPEWLNLAETVALGLQRPRRGLSIGVDPAEGGDSSCWSVVDDLGLIHLLRLKTPDTTVITARTKALAQQFGVLPENIWFDRGGGGKEHVDRLRDEGWNVNTVSFGEAASTIDLFKMYKSKGEQRHDKETRTVNKNRRAELYWITRQLLDPMNGGFAIPAEYSELRRQLEPIPLGYDSEGKHYLLPKHKNKPGSKEETLLELLGCSPDEADSFALANYGLVRCRKPEVVIGAMSL